MEFTVLPDNSAGASIGALLYDALSREHHGVEVLAHSSGRPWIVGRWHSDELVTATVGDRHVALLGLTHVDAAEFTRAVAGSYDLRALDTTARTVPGAFHLAASFGGRVRVQGSVSGTHQIFYSGVGTASVAADSPHGLTRLTGAGVDEDVVAHHLLSPLPPWPLYERGLWSGVRRLATDSYLELTTRGDARPTRWWTPPPSETPADEAVDAIRSALTEAVRARTDSRTKVSADLTGGMDSTTICHLASESSARLMTTRFTVRDPSNDDGRWAADAAAGLPGVEHRVLSHERAPLNFAGLTEPEPDAEAPFAWLRARAQHEHLARATSAWGADRHLTGHGGDELFVPLPSYYHTLVRRRPFKHLRRLGAQRALYRWPLGGTLKELADRGSYARWLDKAAESVTEPERSSAVPSMGWSVPPVLAPWTTSDAVDTVRRSYREAAKTAPRPLSPSRAQHQFLQGVHQCADAVRLSDRLARRFGTTWHAPFLDTRVLEAAISVKLEDHCDPRRYKPVLSDAMRGAVPQHVLGRQTKGEHSEDVYAGLRRHKPELLTLTDDMRLARMGLVDARVFRSALVGPHPYSYNIALLLSTLSCEVWLRSVEHRRSKSAGLARQGGIR
ncbi:asparagine synthase-related protein [Streptomyces sp. NPDC050433]|uniref:asparagine synthase-related protein n=1 Tax=Streptomyces sp. NPDC050433 TaxID=3365615 RepID=UPI0037B44374